MLKILADVETSDLLPGDVVVHSDGAAYFFASCSEIPNSEYVRITWSQSQDDDTLTWTSTAQPWNTWVHVIREH